VNKVFVCFLRSNLTLHNVVHYVGVSWVTVSVVLVLRATRSASELWAWQLNTDKHQRWFYVGPCGSECGTCSRIL